MDTQVESFYRSLFTDLKVSPEEAQELVDYFSKLNPPPDKLVWLRATAFRVGSEFFSDDKDKNVALLRAINAVVHSLEKTCMVPVMAGGNSVFDGGKVEEFYKEIFEDMIISRKENSELMAFFKENIPPAGSLVALRATAFKAAVEYLSDEKQTNITLLKCINVVVHAFESSCLKPKEYHLKLAPAFDLDVNLSDAIQNMWDLDVNRLTPNTDYRINVQGGKKPYWKEDSASDPLFTFVDRNALKRPTYRTFMALLDNYEAETGQAETITRGERSENWAFLKAIMQTAPMQFCHKYLYKKKPSEIPSDATSFMKLLHKIWFELYRRETRNDSSGFEHVFVGEVKNGSVTGFHNWIQFYLEEKRGKVDYRGYIKPRCRSEAQTNSDDHVLTLQFSWEGVEKFVGTSFIGVSPEFEVAVYTTCFLLGEEENEVVLNTGSDEFELKIKCYTMARDKIGTSFPEATAHYD